jgi:hypothetical protein
LISINLKKIILEKDLKSYKLNEKNPWYWMGLVKNQILCKEEKNLSHLKETTLI